MQAKKTNIQNLEGQLRISIRDGYVEGDALNLNSQDTNYTWNAEKGELLIPTSIDSADIYNILDNISLSTTTNEVEKFIAVEYVFKDGEILSLEEYALNTSNVDIEEVSTEELIQEQPLSNEQVPDIFLSFDYEENRGADFLESSVEENFLYEINLKENGEIYKILKDSFEATDTLEIHGINLTTDKLSLEEFSKEFGDSFNYSVSYGEDSLNVNIHVDQHEYNVVLKDVMPDSDTSLEDVIQNIIINGGDYKI
ncbi:MAG: hypothetical protein LBQ34_00775 [Alphaproteobacteria bacterium]|jgi:hypothetical protein|nr:hypothetical protein [Alphaproteobacteria bacterium]